MTRVELLVGWTLCSTARLRCLPPHSFWPNRMVCLGAWTATGVSAFCACLQGAANAPMKVIDRLQGPLVLQCSALSDEQL